MIFRTLEKYFYGVVIYYQHFVKSRKRPRNLLQCFSPPGAARVIRNTSIKVLCTEEENENLKHTKTSWILLQTLGKLINQIIRTLFFFSIPEKTDPLDTLLSRPADKSI